MEDWITTFTSLTAGEAAFKVTFDLDEGFGMPGAFIIKNLHHSEFYLKAVTLEDVPDHGRMHFVCNSWVYPTDKYKYDRVFFANKVNYLHEISINCLQINTLLNKSSTSTDVESCLELYSKKYSLYQ